MLERVDELREDGVDGKCGARGHCCEGNMRVCGASIRLADSLGELVGEGAMELRDEARGIFADALRAVRIDAVMQREVR